MVRFLVSFVLRFIYLYLAVLAMFYLFKFFYPPADIDFEWVRWLTGVVAAIIAFNWALEAVD